MNYETKKHKTLKLVKHKNTILGRYVTKKVKVVTNKKLNKM